MTNEHDYTIELIKITPMNIESKDFKSIEQTITKIAGTPQKGVSEIDIFNKFAATLEDKFQAEISTFNPPTGGFKHWMLYLPKDGNFDATTSWFSISFSIKRNENL